jgi:hypothetical protein
MRLYNEEVSNYLVLLTERRESLYTRAGLLVASAAVATSFASSNVIGPWIIAAMLFGAASAVLGVVALWPKPVDTLNITAVRNKLLVDESADGVERIADTKFVQVEPALARNKRTAYLIRAGFLALVAAIICAMLHALGVGITITIGA